MPSSPIEPSISATSTKIKVSQPTLTCRGLTDYMRQFAKAANETEQRYWFLLAVKKSLELKSKLPDSKQEEKDRNDMVGRAVGIAKEALRKQPLTARAIAMDVVAVYTDVTEMRRSLRKHSKLSRKQNNNESQRH